MANQLKVHNDRSVIAVVATLILAIARKKGGGKEKDRVPNMKA